MIRWEKSEYRYRLQSTYLEGAQCQNCRILPFRIRNPFKSHSNMRTFHLFLLLLAASSATLSAQPELDPFIPCHHSLQALPYRYSPGPEEQAQMENSNRRSDSIDILNYRIDIDVSNYSGKSIIAQTTVRFQPRIDSVKWIVLDLKGLEVDSVYFEGLSVVFNYDGQAITVFFDRVLDAGTAYDLIVFYRGMPVRDPVWGGFYFEDGYIYNLGIGLSTTPPNFGKVWFPCFDNFVERSTYDYLVTTTADKRAHCVGNFISEDTLGPNRIRRHYRMSTPITTYLSAIAAADYSVSEAIHPAASRDLPVRLIAKASDLGKMLEQFEKIGIAVDAFEYWFGPYRFDRVGYVTTTVGAMEHPTNVAYPVSTVQSGNLLQNERLYGHELGHHWWGDITTLDDARDMWIKEGTAEYSSHLFIERAYGKQAFVEAVKSNLSNILFNAHKNDGSFLPLSPMPYEHTYGTHTYRKGAAMIHNLRGYLGDDEFRRMCTMVFDSMEGKSMDAYAFRDFLNRNASRDLTAYFDDYIFNPGYCTFYIDSLEVFQQSGSQFVRIGVRQGAYNALHLYRDVPLQVSLYDASMQRIVSQFTASGVYSLAELPLPDGFQPVLALLNEDQVLNLSTLQSGNILRATGTADLPYTALTVNVSKITDSSLVHVAHHLTGPEASNRAPYIDRVSSRHFWQVSVLQHGELNMEGRLEYNGLDSASIDSDILFTSEDSVLLIYRPDRSLQWSDYPHYNKLVVNPNDRKGFVRITRLLPGEYALAHGFRPPVSTEQASGLLNLSMHPNPTSDRLHLEGLPAQGEPWHFQISDEAGKLVASGTVSPFIDLHALPAGNFVLTVYSEAGSLVGRGRFVKQ